MKNSYSITLKRLVPYITKYRGRIICSLLMSLISVAASLYVPILIGRAIDLIIRPVDIKGIVVILIRTLIVVVISALAQYIISYENNILSIYVVRDLRNDAFAHLNVLPFTYLDKKKAGDIMAAIVADADQLSEGLLMGFTQLFTGVATILGTICFMFSLNALIAVAVVVITPLSLFVAKFISGRTYSLFKKQSEVRGRQSALTVESLKGIKTVKAYSAERDFVRRFDELNEELSDVAVKAVFYSSLTNPCTRFVNSIVYAVVSAAGAIAIISGRMTVGVWSCFLNYANQYTKPFNEISGVITELTGALASAERLFDLIDEMPEVTDEGLKGIDDVRGDVRFDGVDFAYAPDKPLIENLSLDIAKGKRVAIVGPTGCGKTTLINLLMRFYDPQKGDIYIDGNNEREITRHSLRDSFGMVLQDTWLKSASVMENIRMGKADATDEEVIEAARKSHAHSFIRRLENGYDTIVGENGGNLSQGEKQLLCISRIMLKFPPMLILDEATSSIDTRTEMKIQSAFDALMENKTSFIVAHRLSTIRNADIILVMRDGKIVESGTHSELLKQDGFYAYLYRQSYLNQN